MHTSQLSIATITWAREGHEENLLREALTQLSLLQIPVYVTDGGSGKAFVHFLHSLPNFTVVEAVGKGLWKQVQSSLLATLSSSCKYVLYTEPDKLEFFKYRLPDFIEQANEEMGIVLPARTADAFASFPSFQQTTENAINFCTAEITQQPYDYTYGPFILNRRLISFFNNLPVDIDWGWRPFAFCMAHRLGYSIQEIKDDNYCPADQRSDDAKERVYRMKQLYQNIEGVVLSTSVETQ